MIKKRLITTAVCLTLVGTTLVSIDSFARGGRGGGHGQSHGVRMTLLERLDSNADGVLTLDEFSARSAERAERRFNKKDTDGDGLLSLEEFSVTGPRRHHRNLDDLDTDALILCVEEALGYELPERPDSEAAFTASDTNADKSVDLEEFLAAGDLRAEARFAEIDSDSDGEVTSDEIEAYQAVLQERHDAKRSCVAEQLDLEDMLN
jgi:Ca2+-binding EF-hand superfamily protein